MKVFKILFGFLTLLTFFALGGLTIIAILDIRDVQNFIVGLFAVLILEILFLPTTFYDSSICIKNEKIKNLTEQYQESLTKIESGEINKNINVEEKDKLCVKTISSSEIVQEIFKSYANAMADI